MNVMAMGGTVNDPTVDLSQRIGSEAGAQNTPPAGGNRPIGASQTTATIGPANSDSSTIYDSRDQNADGIVSYEEDLRYLFTHPRQPRTTGTVPETYNQQGRLEAPPTPARSRIDIYA